MKQNCLPEIITDRLLLRKLEQTDWKMISYLRSDKQVNKFVKRQSAESKEMALEFISKTNIGIDNLNLYYWAITEKNNNEMIGSICLWKFSEIQNSAEIGYDLSPKFQGKGIMTESLNSVLDFGFKDLNLDYIEAYTHEKNENSKKLLKKNGFTLVKNKKDDQNPDNVIYEIKSILITWI